jgi:hypothetical protein
MKRLSRRRFLKTSLLAFATSMILIPAASAVPVLSDSTKVAPTQQPVTVTGPLDGYITRTAHGTIPSPAAKPAVVSGPMDGYITRTADGTIPSLAALSKQPLIDGWQPGVLGSTNSFSVGRSTPDVPPVSTSAPVLSSPSGFEWGDAGLGLALGLGIAAFMAFGAIRARRARHVPVLH